MIHILKSVAGIAAGVAVAVIAYWFAAVVALISMHGIPLGSPGGPPTPADVSVYLLFGAAATFGGALVATRIAGRPAPRHALLVGALLAAGAFAGFSKPSSNWPAWFPFAIASACACGAALAGRIAAQR